MSVEELQWRRWLVCGSGLIYWAGVLLQARRIRRQIGRSPNLKPRGATEKALWLGWFMVILTWVGQPLLLGSLPAMPGLTLMPALLHPASMAAGLVLLTLGYAGTLWAYAAMGNTWRIGINPDEKTQFVSRGPYRRVRHPIYVLQIAMLGGAALLLPTLVSLAILAVHYICVRIKARDEERYLLRVQGAAYHGYLSSTGGLFPRLVRGGSTTKNGEVAH